MYGSEPAVQAGPALFAEISPPCEFPCNICFRLHVRRASPPIRDLAIDYPRSRLGGLVIFHVNTRRSTRNFPCKSEVKFGALARASPTNRAGSPPY